MQSRGGEGETGVTQTGRGVPAALSVTSKQRYSPTGTPLSAARVNSSARSGLPGTGPPPPPRRHRANTAQQEQRETQATMLETGITSGAIGMDGRQMDGKGSTGCVYA